MAGLVVGLVVRLVVGLVVGLYIVPNFGLAFDHGAVHARRFCCDTSTSKPTDVLSSWVPTALQIESNSLRCPSHKLYSSERDSTLTPMYPSCPSVWQPSPAADKRVDVGVLVTVVGGVDISVVVIVVEEVL